MGKRTTNLKPMAFNAADIEQYMRNNSIHLTTGELTEAFVAGMAAKLAGKAKATKDQIDFTRSTLESLQHAAEQIAASHPEAVRLSQRVEGEVEDADSAEPMSTREVELEGEDGKPLHVKLDSDEPNEGEAEDEEAEAKKGSIVPAKFRDEYKARGDATNCGDAIAKFLKRATVDSKGGSRVEILQSILAQNGVAWQRWEGQLLSGKVGQFRMNSGNELRRKVAVDGYFLVPSSVFKFLETAGIKHDDLTIPHYEFDEAGHARLKMNEEFVAKWMPAKLKKAAAVSTTEAEKAMVEAAEAEGTPAIPGGELNDIDPTEAE